MATPMDNDGYFNLSLSPGDMESLVDSSRLAIVHVNDKLPYINTKS